MRFSTNKVFVDAGAFIALLSEDDRHHEEAARTYGTLLRNRQLLYTTNHIVDETCSWLLRNRASSHRAALTFGDMIRAVSVPVTVGDLPDRVQQSKMMLVYSTPEVENLAWEILAEYDSAGFSYTDCTSFAVMTILFIKKAFTFDAHFDVMGFERL